MRIREFIRQNNGGAATEFALIATPFLALILAALQLTILFLAQEILETAAEQVGRQVLTGKAQKMSQAQFKTLVCAAVPAFLKCSGIFADVQTATTFASANTGKPTITYDSDGNVSNTWVYQPGAPGDIVVLRLVYQWPLVSSLGFNLKDLPNGTRMLMATSVFKNENYR